MALQIKKTFPQQQGKHTRRIKSNDYLSWIKSLPCVVTLQNRVDAAHVSFPNLVWGAPGRGKSQKVSDRWALPLCRAEHDIQHSMNEREYWKERGINPHALCCALYGLWCERKGEEKLNAMAAIIIRNKEPL